jgi:transposase-like protein
MLLFSGLAVHEFMEKFSTNESCLAYLAELKWQKGYQCGHCGHTVSCKGRLPSARRCIKCHYDESATAGTLFHKLKFEVKKAFWIVYQVVGQKQGASAMQLSRDLELRKNTAWAFKRKVQEAMQSSERHLLTGNIEVDETYIGGHAEGQRGRSLEEKVPVVLALEIRGGQVGRAYGLKVENCGGGELMRIFDKHIDREALVKTDAWKGYLPVREAHPHLVQEKSDPKQNFQRMHQHISNLKSWLRGTHRWCSGKHLQAYLDEFHYRFNRRGFPESMFEKLIMRMIAHKPLNYKDLLGYVP